MKVFRYPARLFVRQLDDSHDGVDPCFRALLADRRNHLRPPRIHGFASMPQATSMAARAIGDIAADIAHGFAA